MELKEKPSLVIIGKWNQAILTHEWILKEFPGNFKQKETPIEYSFDINAFRFTIDNILIQPTSRSLILFAEKLEEKLYKKISGLASGIVDKLPHTPIIAIGHNIAYYSKKVNFFNYSKLDDLQEEYKKKITTGVINSQQIKHSIEFEDHVLNLSFNINRKKCFIDFNYHYPIKSISNKTEIINKFKENIIHSKSLLKELMV